MEIRFIKGGLTLILILATCQLFGQSDDYMQESTYKPFSVLIISPDSSKLDRALGNLTDSIELEYRETYYRAIKELEVRKTVEAADKTMENEMTIQRAKWMEMELYDFKYYQMISIGTFVTLLENFNKYPWAKKSLTCEIEERRWLFTYDMERLVKYYNVDYIIYFQDITAFKDDGNGDTFTIKMTTSLFSRADSKVIMKKKTTGTSENVYCKLRKQNKLMCLLTTIIESSTDELISVLSEKQKK